MEKCNCMECGQEFIGRSDKKFCTDQCRSAYNNRLNSDSTNMMKSINYSLRKNRRILIDLLVKGNNKVEHDHLVQLGFILKYCTHDRITNNGKQYKFWYDHGILMEKDAYYICREGEVK